MDCVEVAVPIPAAAVPAAPGRWAGSVGLAYAVPDGLRERVRAGQWVWVPLGSRELPGIVLGPTQPPLGLPLKPIVGLVLEEPVLDEGQIEIARWISEHYLEPIYKCLRLFLPPSAVPRAEVMYQLVDAALAKGEAQRAVVAVLAREGAMTALALQSRLLEQGLRVDARRALEGLVRRHAVARVRRITRSRGSSRAARKLFVVGTLEDALAKLAMAAAAKPEQKALMLLAEAQREGDPFIGLELLREKARLSERQLKGLMSSGVVQLLPEEVVLRPAHGEVPGTGLSAQAAALLGRLQALGEAYFSQLEQEGFSAEAAAELKSKGLARESRVPPMVTLTVPVERAYELALPRRLHAAARALRTLHDSGQPLCEHELRKVCGAGRQVIAELIRVGAVAAADAGAGVVESVGCTAGALAELEPEDKAVVQPIVRALRAGDGGRFLLPLAPGANALPVYVHLVAEALASGRRAVLLVPEISLTQQLVQSLREHFPGRLAVQHSGLGEAQRCAEWERLRAGKADVVIGTRLALFAPVSRLGLIIVHEEEDVSYKQAASPHYHTREVAIRRAAQLGAVVVLASACPDVGTYGRAKAGELQCLPRLRAGRWGGESWPGHLVQLVDMREEVRAGNTGLLSRQLRDALEQVLGHDQQAILLLNRRGRATLVVCSACGFVWRCPRCDLALVGHALKAEEGGRTEKLLCHSCRHEEPMPDSCPLCGSSAIRLRGKGTQRLQAEVQAAFPGVRVLRWDSDVQRRSHGKDEVLGEFARGEAQVLVGTQLVATEPALPQVTLAAAVLPDTMLSLPDYRASERTFQLLVHLLGRVRSGGGRMLVQTFHPEHYALHALQKGYEHFADRELEWRRRVGYPPERPLIRLLFLHESEQICESAARRLAWRLHRAILEGEVADVEIIGPSPCYYARLRGRSRWHIILRGEGASQLLMSVPLAAGWRVDVDPLDLL